MLTVQGITRSFDGQPVLQGIDLEVPQGEILCLLGPSGCGKTTLLRIIAGLEQADSGDVLINGHSIITIPVHQRGFGLMFQDFALFPHLDVSGNIAFGLKMQGLSSVDQQRRIEEVLQTVNLLGYEKRDVAQLSGGERQRVALARSLAPNPRLLMLDEPLGSLDAALREQLVVELRSIIKKLGLTAVYVTHDQHEAFAIADRIALMNTGILQQVDTPEAVYRYPSTTFTARFLGLHNVYPVLNQNDDAVHTALGSFQLSRQARHILLHPAYLTPVSMHTAESITGVIKECVFTGDSYRIRIRHVSGETLLLKLSASNGHTPALGESISVRVPPQAIVPLSN